MLCPLDLAGAAYYNRSIARINMHVILNKEGKYVGSITEGDLLWAVKKLKLLNLKDAENISIMKIDRRNDYQCVNAESKMEDLIGRAMEQNFVPVVDDQEHFIGMITRRDIIKYCYDKITEYEKNGN